MSPAFTDFLSMAAFLVVFALTCGIGTVLLYRTFGYDRAVRNRLRALAPESETDADASAAARTPLSALGGFLLPRNEEKIAPLLKQMRCAGFEEAQALHTFYGIKFLLILALPFVCALPPFLLNYVSLKWAFIISAGSAAGGIIVPNLWLEFRIQKRQRELRAALPDMLDMLVMCIEGGLSFQASLQRVVGEIQEVHLALGGELKRLMQAIELGATAGEALKQLAERCVMSELRDLAAVVEQSEKYGASLIKSLRTHADQFRDDRQMRAEEGAHKASVKILFPMLVCIFPAIFVVLLGPASFQIAKLFK